MKKIIYWVFLVGIIIATLVITFRQANAPSVALASEIKAPSKPILTHQQEVYRSALEWCESRGVKSAINPNDRDNTPSYYSWQFKPSTFKGLGIKYGVLKPDVTDAEVAELLKDYQLQKDIVGFMILDKDTKWNIQFPDCVKNKIGRPPVIK